MGNNFLNIFDGSDIEGISALIDKLEKSSFDYLKLEGGGMSVTIGKNGVCEDSGTGTLPAGPGAVTPAAPIADTAGPDGTTSTAGAEEAKEKCGVPEQEGIFIIRSPSYGLFYAQSEPGAPPYVTVGGAIEKDDTIGLMEIMKTFTAVTSPVAGVVAAIHVKNEETLEPDQPLVSVQVTRS